MLKTRTFVEYETLKSIFAYEEFIKKNQHIKVIAVNVFSGNHILLTYEE